MRWYYSPAYDYGRNLPHEAVHGFVLDKPSRIYRHLLTGDVLTAGEVLSAPPVDEAEVAGVHEPGVLTDLRDAYAVSRAVEFDALARLPNEVVWQAAVAPQLAAAGGTCAALQDAADGRWSTNLSGGFHHARPDLAHGFCLVNDVALGLSRLRRAGGHPPVLILDLDLHQGDGNAIFFAKDDHVFTFSMHEHTAFPVPKAMSDLDVGLPRETGAEEYLRCLDDALVEIAERIAPRIIVYVAGSDPYVGDPLGSLQLDEESMAERDRRVARFAVACDSALVTLPAGGYSEESAALTAAGLAEIAALEPAA